MKCGTTSLHEYLDIHHSIGMSRPKEVDFFSGNNAKRSLEWYKSLFSDEDSVRGESSQNYTKHHHPHFAGAFEKMREVIPSAKLIYVVRDPIERYKSHVSYNYFNESDEANKFNESIDHYMKTGLYFFQMQEILKYYDLSQVLVVDLNDLRESRHKTLNSIFRFLGVEELPDDGRFAFERNKHEDLRVPKRVRTNLGVRAASKLAPRLTESVLTSKPVQKRLRRGGIKKLESWREAELKEIYHEDADKLRALTGMSFDSWSV